MSHKTQIKLAGSRKGRVVLHVVAMIRDRRWVWHVSGILRELAPKAR